MRLVIQRVTEATVSIHGKVISQTGAGVCVFLGIARGDTREDADYLAEKAVGLRIFEDSEGKFNRSLFDVGGEVLVVSEFTLYGDCTKGRRPSFNQAAPPEEAEPLYHRFVQTIKESGFKVATGTFQTKMTVSIANDGPVTLILDSR